MEIIRKNYKRFIIAVLVLNIIGALLVFFSPFGGMTVATYYGPRERYASLGAEYSEATDNLFILLISISLIITAFLSLVMFKTVRFIKGKTIKLTLCISVITVLLAIIGGVLYDIVRADTAYLDWWPETCFYTGIIVGLINSVFYGIMLRKDNIADISSI